MSRTRLDIPSSDRQTTRPRQPRWSRLLAVGAAVAAAVLVWSLATQVIGVDLHSPAMPGSTSGVPVGLGQVVLVSALAALAGWALLALLEWRTRRAPALWLAAALIAFVLSLGGPLSGTSATVEDRFVLVLLHLVVAAVLIPMMYRSSRLRERAGTN